MIQAILITAYKDVTHLKKIINFFDENFSIYIHIDRKSSLSKLEIDELKTIPNVKFAAKRYNVNWGGFNHLKAILFLSSIALKDEKNFYFHLISGNDFPIKTVNQFNEFFKENKKNIYLSYFDVPFHGWANNGGLDRIDYYNFFDLWNFKISREKYRINRVLNVQKRLGIKRKLPSNMPKLYGGSTWWSMNKTCLEYVINFTQLNRYVLKRFRYTFCSEEFYFQTVVMNSEFRSSVINNSLRHIDWVPRNGNNPAVLDESDYEKLIKSNAFFARKFENPVSSKLLDKLQVSLNDHQNNKE